LGFVFLFQQYLFWLLFLLGLKFRLTDVIDVMNYFMKLIKRLCH